MQPQERNYHHPFKPYDIQLKFMTELYDCIEHKQVGIFESPTGTGKSLSLICGALTWLRDRQLSSIDDEVDAENADGEPQWILEHAKAEKRDAFLRKKQDFASRLQKVRATELRQQQRYESGEPLPKRTVRPKVNAGPSRTSKPENDNEFLLEDYESDDGQSQHKPEKGSDLDTGLSGASLELAVKLGIVSKPANEEEVEMEDSTKIFYCSRTHSQLIQFANEVRRIKIPVPHVESTKAVENDGNLTIEEVKHLTLGSRKNLCINVNVNKLGSAIAINERCLELQQSKTPSEKKCAFLPTKENETLVHQFRDLTLAKIRDIEDLGDLGKKVGICPYYATRATIKPSELVTLPYPLLLQKSSREALDISLKGHIVIIDEAHNLMDAISGMYSVEISLEQLKTSREQIGVYLQKFRNKLKGKNRVYVTQTVRLIDSLVLHLEQLNGQSNPAEGVVKMADLMIGKGTDQINLYKLSNYLQESKLARKVDGYALHIEENKAIRDKAVATTPVLSKVQTFFQALTYPATEGRFFYTKTDNKDVVLRYLLLDPANHFREIVEEARAVILAGGTMSPVRKPQLEVKATNKYEMEDYRLHLFPYLDPARLRTLSCGHVIPDGNLIAWPLSQAPNSVEFDFTYGKRSLPAVIRALGLALVELSRTIPDGLVAFFPSYAYLELVTSAWKKREHPNTSIWSQLESLKPIFEESKGTASVDDVLERYSAAISQDPAGRGALLLSVVGGKMSEGINFSDRLGRGVVIVGLPFPNIQSPEWKAKLEYIEQQTTIRGGSLPDGKNAARTFYENACMRAVNQSIGRAIRHKGDYATIVMLDRRYNTSRIQEKLPAWIQKGLERDAGRKSFEEAINSIERFFKTKKGESS